MNSGHGKSNGKTSSINAFDFDIGLGSGRQKSMNDQKHQTPSYSSTTTYAYASAQQKTNTSASSWSQQSKKTTWTHQPAASAQSSMKGGSLSGPTSMVGDIFGKTWSSSASSNSVGVVDNKSPNLFGDLLSSAMGVNKSSSNVPLKSVATSASQNTFSMGSVAGSLPKAGYSAKGTGTWSSNVGGGDGTANPSGTYKTRSSPGDINVNFGGRSTSNQTLEGPSMKSMTGNGAGKGSVKDPFGSLVDFSSKAPSGIGNLSKESEKKDIGADPFGEFQNPGPNISFSSAPAGAFAANAYDPLDGFGFSTAPSGNQTRSSNQQPSATTDFDTLFSSTAGNVTGSVGLAKQQFSDGDDWGINSEFIGGNDTGGTTELEGLPPPPAGFSAHTATNKGIDSYKQGQFADGIKWLSWALILLEKASDVNGSMEVLTCRASCYKEVGEYKKAVADCTRVLEHDGENVAVLVQRALLYESMEKYKLGAEDLRTVMKLDPGNRVARSTIHRLVKMAD